MSETLGHKRLAKNIGKYRSMQKAMEKSEYTKSYAKSGLVKKTKGFQEAMKPIMEQLETERMEALKEARKKRGTAQYAQLMQAVKDLTNQIQLLGGKPTEITKTFNEEQVNAIARRISNGDSSGEEVSD